MKIVPILLLSLLAAGPLAANPLQNPGFENGADRWDVSDGMSTVTDQAARTGQKGLRIEDKDAANGSSVNSEVFPVKPGETLRVSFWARSSDAKFLGVMVVFKNEAGQWLKDDTQRATQGLYAAIPDNADGEWHQYTVEAPVPDDAATVRLWLHWR